MIFDSVSSLQMTNDQQVVLAQKETEITTLQQKLTVMEDFLSQLQSAFTPNNMEQIKSISCHNGDILSGIDTSPENNLDSSGDLIQRLKHELDEERQNSKRAQECAENLQEMILKFEKEKVEMEAKLRCVQDDLECAERRACEAQQFKTEKERLNQEVVRLDELVQELQDRIRKEEETSMQIHSKYKAEIANCELRLQALEEERVLNVAQLNEAHEAMLKRLGEEHSEEVKRIQELVEQVQVQAQNYELHSASSELDTSVKLIQTSVEHINLQMATEASSEAVESMNASATDDLMERYLTSAAQHENSWTEQNIEEHSIMENSAVSKLEFEDESRFFVHFESGSRNTNPEHDLSGLDGTSFNQVRWQSFNSTSNGMNESVDLAKELLIQQCKDLTEQLEVKERQLDVLQEEVQRSAEELVEARDRWSKASEELEEARLELDTERDKRIHFEELLNEKIHEQDNLKNNLSYLESQKAKEQITSSMEECSDDKHFSTEEILKELKEDKIKLVFQLKCQEQLVHDIQEQKLAGDSVSSEVQAVFGKQLSSLQAQRDQLMAQLDNQREKNQITSVLLGQKTLEVDSAHSKLQQLRAEVEAREEKVKQLEKVQVDLESKLMCLKENLSNVEEALRQGSAEKAALEEKLQVLDEQNKSMEKVLETELESFEVCSFSYFIIVTYL